MLNKKLLALLLLIGVSTTSCASEQTFIQSEQAIKDLGYSQVEYQGWAWYACGEDDNFSLKYTAVSQSGRQVTLAACSGFFKGVTVRTID